MSKTALIVPCFNEGSRLQVLKYVDFLSANEDIHFFFADDGSTDNTPIVLADLKSRFPEKVHVHTLNENQGKAEAIRKAALALPSDSYNSFGYWDADLSTPLSEIAGMKAALERYIVVMGSRWKRLGSVVERNPWRHITGRIFSTLASITLNLPVYDTQCGAKLFRIDCVLLFGEQFSSRWLFDVELLARYRNQHGADRLLREVYEWPLSEWKDTRGSKLALWYKISVPFALMKIYMKYRKR
jgi:dolichyl-phosphate beta-glucosyltransferase